MKSVTEFPSHKLVQGLNEKSALVAEGKTPEEILAKLGETFKMEGEKLKFFFNACDIAGQNLDKLSRVRVLSFAEGESVPHKAVKVEEHHYLPEFQVEFKPKTDDKKDAKGGKGGRKGGGRDKKGGGQKESPWGLSPEQKAAKKGGGQKAKAAGGGAAPAGGGAPKTEAKAEPKAEAKE